MHTFAIIYVFYNFISNLTIYFKSTFNALRTRTVLRARFANVLVRRTHTLDERAVGLTCRGPSQAVSESAALRNTPSALLGFHWFRTPHTEGVYIGVVWCMKFMIFCTSIDRLLGESAMHVRDSDIHGARMS